MAARLRRSCDRCHSLKERCCWSKNAAKCDRCLRLKQDCAANRPVLKAGRKPRSRPVTFHAAAFVTQRSLSSHTSPEQGGPPSVVSENASISLEKLETEVLTTLRESGDLNDMEESVLKLCFSNEEAVGQFTIGRSFHQQHQIDLLSRLSQATTKLRDGFVCCGAMFARSLNIPLSVQVLELCQQRAASAVLALREMEITTREDLSTCLVLGVVVTTFALFVAGGETSSICRCVLGHLKRYYPSDVQLATDEKAFIKCLIATDLSGCILRARAPILRYVDSDDPDIDRYYGLSSPILQYLHDICQVCNMLANTEQHQRESYLPQLYEIEQCVRQWRANIPCNITNRLDQMEMVNVMAQVKALRLTCLLLILRLRHPFGEQLEHARTIAEAIVLEVELAKQVTGQMAEGLDLGLIVALFELSAQHRLPQALDYVELLPYSGTFRAKLIAQLSSVRTAIQGFARKVYWDDLHHYLQP